MYTCALEVFCEVVRAITRTLFRMMTRGSFGKSRTAVAVYDEALQNRTQN